MATTKIISISIIHLRKLALKIALCCQLVTVTVPPREALPSEAMVKKPELLCAI